MGKRLKSAAALLLALVLCLGLGANAFAYDAAEAGSLADALNTLGLFKGTDSGYDLDSELTRAQALVLLVRLIGQEVEALYGEERSHPFTDIPQWVNGYVGYGYENGLAAGVTPTEFQPDERASAQVFVTFVLRALGYKDSADGTVWDNWKTLAESAGILPDGVNTDKFLRGDAVVICYAALDAKVQGGEGTLADKLLADGAFNSLALATARALAGNEVTAQSSLIDIMGAVYAGVDTMEPSRLHVAEITEENLSFYFGAENIPFVEGIACEPMMTAQAHSVGLLRVKDGTDIEKTKADIRENVNPRKWICVGVSPSNIRVESIGNLILLVMDNSAPDELARNFRALDSSLATPDAKGMIKIGETYMEAGETVDQQSVSRLARVMENLRATYFADSDVYYAIVPDKTYYARELTADYINHSAIVEQLSYELLDWKTADLTGLLTLDDYYVTDPHWRQEELLPVAEELGKLMGFTVNRASFTTQSREGFVGTYRQKLANLPGETVRWLTSSATEAAVVDNFSNQAFKEVYDVARLDTDIAYDLFLSGATPLTVIENPNAAAKRELVIFRDSYASSLAPLLIENYSKITMVDLRYMHSSLLPEYVDFTDADVLFLYSDRLANDSLLLKADVPANDQLNMVG